MKHNGTVRALDNNTEVSLGMVFDHATNRYFYPYRPDPDFEAIRRYARAHGVSTDGAVAVLDTGVLSHHPLLEDRIIDAVDFTGEGTEDLSGHGTIVALILCQAPGTQILNVKILDRDKCGQEDDVIAGLEWAATHNATWVNLSAGIVRSLPCDGTCTFCRATRAIVQRYGLRISMAAGNRPGPPFCPAPSRSVLVIGALDRPPDLSPRLDARASPPSPRSLDASRLSDIHKAPHRSGGIAAFSADAQWYVPDEIAMLPVERLQGITSLVSHFGKYEELKGELAAPLGLSVEDRPVPMRTMSIQMDNLRHSVAALRTVSGGWMLFQLVPDARIEWSWIMYLASRQGMLEAAVVSEGDGSLRTVVNLENVHRAFENEVLFWRQFCSPLNV